MASSADNERGLDAVLAVLQALEAWDSFEQGANSLLRDLAGALGLQAGALWLSHGDELVARSVWTMPRAEGAAIERTLRSLRFPAGVGPPGRAWLYREPVHQAIAGAHDCSRQLRPILRNDIRASVAFPALAAGEVLAVLELYGASRIELTGRLRQVFVALGQQLGDFFARRRGELDGSPLTVREREILMLVAVGLTASAIAERLVISLSTVKTHLEHIYAKFGVSDRASAVAHALRLGLIQ